MSDSVNTSAGGQDWPEPQDWTITDLQEQMRRLVEELAAISRPVQQVQAWAGGLPVHHQPVPKPVRVADLASTELEAPLSLARRVIELRRQLGQVEQLAQTLLPAVALEAGPLFAPEIWEQVGAGHDLNVDDAGDGAAGDHAADGPGGGPGGGGGQLPDLVESPAGPGAPLLTLVAHCHSAWDDDASFEAQRQAIRRVLSFDGNRTWHGRLAPTINDDLAGWSNVITAAEAGAHVEIRLCGLTCTVGSCWVPCQSNLAWGPGTR